MHPLDVSDDRLAAVRRDLRDDDRWGLCEGALTPHLVRVYDLQPERGRVASLTASGDWRVTADGRFQCGPSQDHRPDLPRVKVMRAALDPLGMPVATDGVAGQRAAEPWYVPAITRVREGLKRRGLLEVGAGNIGALATRAFLHAGGDYYLGPLSALQVPPDGSGRLPGPGLQGRARVDALARVQANGEQELIADGLERLAPLTAVVAAAPIGGAERRLVLRSHRLAQAGERALRARLAKAQAAIAARHERRRRKRRVPELPARQKVVAAMVARDQVPGCCRCARRHRCASDRGGAMETGRPRDGWSRTGT